MKPQPPTHLDVDTDPPYEGDVSPHPTKSPYSITRIPLVTSSDKTVTLWTNSAHNMFAVSKHDIAWDGFEYPSKSHRAGVFGTLYMGDGTDYSPYPMEGHWQFREDAELDPHFKQLATAIITLSS